jgi:hypothetical protein
MGCILYHNQMLNYFKARLRLNNNKEATKNIVTPATFGKLKQNFNNFSLVKLNELVNNPNFACMFVDYCS